MDLSELHPDSSRFTGLYKINLHLIDLRKCLQLMASLIYEKGYKLTQSRIITGLNLIEFKLIFENLS